MNSPLAKSEECVIGSGMCAKHNIKAIRVLKTMRMSVINKDGPLGWRLCETTILACPVSQNVHETSAVSQNNQSDRIFTANKKVRRS